MKRIISISSLLLMFLFLIGCQEEEKCSGDFQNQYNNLAQQYIDLYQPHASLSQLNYLKQGLDNFLSKYKNYSCTIDGKTINPTVEIEKFLAQNTKVLSKISEAYMTIYGNKIVYGKDNREDVADVANEDFRKWAAATAAQISPSKIDSQYNIISETIGASMRLCPTERFIDQLNPARCSGFLVAPNILVTAGHCVTGESECANYQWVFNFNRGVTTLDPKNIYSCKRIIKRALLELPNGEAGPDYAVLELDREVVDRIPLKFRRAGSVRKDSTVIVIGHPSGLPTKITDSGKIRDTSKESYFVTNLDTFGGNSGSAVLDAETGLIEGILVRGDTDYVPSTNSNGTMCMKVNVCSEDGCGGEEVTRITVAEGLDFDTSPLDGGWSDWGEWSECIDGRKNRFRECNNPAPETGGNDCVGYSEETKSCLNVTKEEIFRGIFEKENLNLFAGKHPLKVYSYRQGNYQIAGRQFLDKCGLHVIRVDSEEWLNFKLVDCSVGLGQLDEIFSEFANYFN